MKAFIDYSDPKAKSGFALQAPDYVDAAVLTGTAVEFTVPTDARYVVFSATADFYVIYGAAPIAVEPVGTISDGSASEANPAVRRLDDIAKISVIGTATTVTLAYYK